MTFMCLFSITLGFKKQMKLQIQRAAIINDTVMALATYILSKELLRNGWLILQQLGVATLT